MTDELHHYCKSMSLLTASYRQSTEEPRSPCQSAPSGSYSHETSQTPPTPTSHPQKLPAHSPAVQHEDFKQLESYYLCGCHIVSLWVKVAHYGAESNIPALFSKAAVWGPLSVSFLLLSLVSSLSLFLSLSSFYFSNKSQA